MICRGVHNHTDTLSLALQAPLTLLTLLAVASKHFKPLSQYMVGRPEICGQLQLNFNSVKKAVLLGCKS